MLQFSHFLLTMNKSKIFKNRTALHCTVHVHCTALLETIQQYYSTNEYMSTRHHCKRLTSSTRTYNIYFFRSRDWSKCYSENGNLATNYVFVSLGVLRLYLGCPPSVPWFVLWGSSRFVLRGVLLVVLMHVLLDVN